MVNSLTVIEEYKAKVNPAEAVCVPIVTGSTIAPVNTVPTVITTSLVGVAPPSNAPLSNI